MLATSERLKTSEDKLGTAENPFYIYILQPMTVFHDKKKLHIFYYHFSIIIPHLFSVFCLHSVGQRRTRINYFLNVICNILINSL